MRFADLITDDAVMRELGGRLGQQRLALNLTQQQLASAAGVGRATLQRLEAGNSVQLVSLLKVLRVLKLLDGLDQAVPEPAAAPLQELERVKKADRRTRKRASDTGDGIDAGARAWRWGDEL